METCFRAGTGRRVPLQSAMRNVSHKLSVARGERPAELLFKNARVINVFSGEIHQTNVAVEDGRIVGFGDYRARKIINPAYQTAADAIVGKMTIAALDADMVKLQKSGSTGIRCNFGTLETGGRRSAAAPPDTVPLAIAARWDMFDKQRRA